MVSRTFTGAWIETLLPSRRNLRGLVAPSRVRGLKQNLLKLQILGCYVAPSRVRGLKQLKLLGFQTGHSVAPSRVRGLKLGYVGKIK